MTTESEATEITEAYSKFALKKVLFITASLAILLLAADTAGRIMFSPVIIPVGIVISYIGVPLFLYLLLKVKRTYWV